MWYWVVTVNVSYLLEERPTAVLGLASVFSLFPWWLRRNISPNVSTVPSCHNEKCIFIYGLFNKSGSFLGCMVLIGGMIDELEKM
jgi:hypothetical protein